MYEAIEWFADSKQQGGIGWPNWLKIVNDISHTLIVFNSAVNFLIYSIL